MFIYLYTYPDQQLEWWAYLRAKDSATSQNEQRRLRLLHTLRSPPVQTALLHAQQIQQQVSDPSPFHTSGGDDIVEARDENTVGPDADELSVTLQALPEQLESTVYHLLLTKYNHILPAQYQPLQDRVKRRLKTRKQSQKSLLAPGEVNGHGNVNNSGSGLGSQQKSRDRLKPVDRELASRERYNSHVLKTKDARMNGEQAMENIKFINNQYGRHEPSTTAKPSLLPQMSPLPPPSPKSLKTHVANLSPRSAQRLKNNPNNPFSQQVEAASNRDGGSPKRSGPGQSSPPKSPAKPAPGAALPLQLSNPTAHLKCPTSLKHPRENENENEIERLQATLRREAGSPESPIPRMVMEDHVARHANVNKPNNPNNPGNLQTEAQQSQEGHTLTREQATTATTTNGSVMDDLKSTRAVVTSEQSQLQTQAERKGDRKEMKLGPDEDDITLDDFSYLAAAEQAVRLRDRKTEESQRQTIDHTSLTREPDQSSFSPTLAQPTPLLVNISSRSKEVSPLKTQKSLTKQVNPIPNQLTPSQDELDEVGDVIDSSPQPIGSPLHINIQSAPEGQGQGHSSPSRRGLNTNNDSSTFTYRQPSHLDESAGVVSLVPQSPAFPQSPTLSWTQHHSSVSGSSAVKTKKRSM